jgi:hypothetical protein
MLDSFASLAGMWKIVVVDQATNTILTVCNRIEIANVLTLGIMNSSTHVFSDMPDDNDRGLFERLPGYRFNTDDNFVLTKNTGAISEALPSCEANLGEPIYNPKRFWAKRHGLYERSSVDEAWISKRATANARNNTLSAMLVILEKDTVSYIQSPFDNYVANLFLADSRLIEEWISIAQCDIEPVFQNLTNYKSQLLKVSGLWRKYSALVNQISNKNKMDELIVSLSKELK